MAQHLPPPGRDGLAAVDADRTGRADRGRRWPHAGLVLVDARRRRGSGGTTPAGRRPHSFVRATMQRRSWCGSSRPTRRRVLFGTLSLWQGVDVPGASCQLVVVDRIPFPRPDDPLMSARQKAVADAGGNGFMAVAAAQAALLLAQGTGRLLRSRTDRGVVAVLDSRLATARYGSFLARVAAAVLVHDRPGGGARVAACARRSGRRAAQTGRGRAAHAGRRDSLTRRARGFRSRETVRSSSRWSSTPGGACSGSRRP